MQPDLLDIFASYTSWKYNEDTWIINFMDGSQNMYLLEGDEKALLIDTGWGSGTLRPYVELAHPKARPGHPHPRPLGPLRQLRRVGLRHDASRRGQRPAHPG